MNRNFMYKKVLGKLISFSIPLILSGLLQQLFNWVDALIVGNIVGETALAGVGATTSLYNLFITTIVGFTSGLSVLFAQQFGKGDNKNNKNLLATYSVILAFIFVVISIIGMIFAGQILTIMDTPKLLLDYAKNYLTTIFIGIPFLAIYNTYSAILRGVGNSKIPFIAVVISSVINIILDYVFIYFCNFGVVGAGVATAISQIAMTVYIVIYTVVKYPNFRFSLFKIKEYFSATKIGCKFGLPPAIQSSVSSVGSLILQRFMNSFGEQTVAAITTAYRVDTVLLLPIINLSTAISTLVAQETGAENHENAKRIFRLGTVLMAVMSIVLSSVIFIAGKPLLSMFGLGNEAITIGDEFFRTISLFYIVYGVSMSIKGYLEGTSDMLFSSIAGISSLVVRIICSYVFVGAFDNMVIAYAEAFAWIYLIIVFTLRYFYKTSRKKLL